MEAHSMADKRDDHDDKVTSGVLGLGGADVPKSPTDPTTEYDEESIARRRNRMADTDVEETTPEDPDRQRSGATGIDMGSGGQGTHVSGK
jgi:hypothetical protein